MNPSGLHLDICENGVKHATWQLTRERAGRDFFAAHTASELAGWSDYELEAAGRLSEPVRYDAASDRYLPISWEDAFELAGSTLRGLASPHEVAFYTSGRLSNEATFLYQLWVRESAPTTCPTAPTCVTRLGDWGAADAIWLLVVVVYRGRWKSAAALP
jgi:anaerobic selenocysteine-containing dehydrogenase